MTAISSIRNLGPAIEAAFEAVGITSAEELRALGADAAYARLLHAGQRPHFIGYYALHMGLQGRPWNDCRDADKAELRRTFDALKDRHYETGLSDIEEILNRIGVVPPKQG